MTLTWSDLTVTQLRLLLKLAKADEGFALDDAVGLPLDRIRDEALLAVGSLQTLGLIEITHGWKGAWWLRLTEAGRQIEDGGAMR